MIAQTTILIVDDAADSLQIIGACLRKHGYNVLLATDGDAGLAMAREHHPQLVITDMLMPGASGFRVIDSLKSNPACTTKIMMISGQDAPHHRAYAASLGVDEFLPKPFDLAQLLEHVQRFCPNGKTTPTDTPLTDDAMIRL